MVSPADACVLYDKRVARYGVLSTALASLSDRRLGELVEEASFIGAGIGGTAVSLQIEGIPVFVKTVPLSELERRSPNILSTANLFKLPTFCQYGLGSAGGGVWREVAAHAMTTNWVLAKRSGHFPLMYHWRVLPGPPPRTPTAEELTEVSTMVAFWDSSPAVRERLEAIARSSACVALCCEYIPTNLHDWLTEQVANGDDAVDLACAMVERNLLSAVSFMNSHGLLHFDPHFRNILTNGHCLYISDFGLALSPRFELSDAESEFVRRNMSHDGCYAVTELVNWLVTALTGTVARADRVEYLRRCAEHEEAAEVTASAAAVIKRFAPIAVVMNDFYGKLYFESRSTPYPLEEIQRVCATTGFEPVWEPTSAM